MSFRTMKVELMSYVPELNAVQVGLRLNRSYQHLLDLHPWSFLKAEALIKLVAPYTTGTIDVTYNSNAVTGHSTVWVAGMVGRWLRSSTNFVIYKIATVTPNTALTLETTYGEPTALVQGYSIFQHQYAKPADCKNVLGVRYDYNLPRQTKSYLDTLDPDRESTGQPNYWLDIDNSTFEVWPVPDQNYTLRMWYNKSVSDMSADTDTSLITERAVLAHARMAAYLQLASDAERGAHYLQLMQAAQAEYTDIWTAAIEEDMRKLSLPTRVLDEGVDFPQSNEYWLSHDVLDPRRWNT